MLPFSAVRRISLDDTGFSGNYSFLSSFESGLNRNYKSVYLSVLLKLSDAL